MTQPSHFEALMRKLERKEALIGIIGLGYVGLPLAIRFCESGFRVMGFDIDPEKIRKLDRGESYIRHIPAAPLESLVSTNRLVPTIDVRLLAEPDALIICVPTPLKEHREPDTSFLESTAGEIVKVLRPGQLVVLESTTYPGTTHDLIRPALERSGLELGRDFFLAYSPEREDPGRTDYTIGTMPKVVGGETPEGTELAAALYGPIVPRVVKVSSAAVAEAAKVLENTYRTVNIALVNELKVLFEKMGLDVWEVIDAAATKPFGFQAFSPGPGVGGHCIPIDPFYLSWKAKEYEVPTRFIELAGEVNEGMPAYVVSRLAAALNDRRKPLRGSKVLLLGIAYKENVDDLRESPALKLVSLLEREGAAVSYHDPYLPKARSARYKFERESVALTEQTLRTQDAVVIVTAHAGIDYAWVVKHARLVVDTRNATRNVTEGREKIVRA